MLVEEIDYAHLSTLVTRTQMGDSDSFAELYAATYKKQYQFAYRYLRDQFLAQDILVQLYILAFENISNLQTSSLFLAWLNQMNFRLCLKTIRDQYEKQSSIQQYEGRKVYREMKLDSIELVEKQEEHDFILEELFSLQLTESEVIIMKYYHGMKLQEIAEVLDIRKSQVKRHLRDARYRLRYTLKNKTILQNPNVEYVPLSDDMIEYC